MKATVNSNYALHRKHLAQAYELARLGRYDLALQEVQRSLELDPRSAEAHACGAWVLRQSGRLDEAEEAAQRALEFDPMLPAAHNARACILWSQGRLLEAEQAFNSAIALQGPDTPLYITNYARMELARQRPAEALQLANKALVLTPSRSAGHEVQGEALRVLGEPRQASEALHAALRLDPRNARAHNSLGQVRLSLGQAGEAQDSFREALRLQPGDAKVQANLVEALRAQYPLYGRLLALTMRLHTTKGRRYFIWVGVLVVLLFMSLPVALDLISGSDKMTDDVTNLWMLLMSSVFAVWLLLVSGWLILQPLFNLLLSLDARNRDVMQRDPADFVGVALLFVAVVSLVAYGVLLVAAGPFAAGSLLALQTGVAGLIAVLLSGAMRGLSPIARAHRPLTWASWGSYAVLAVCLYVLAAGSALNSLARLDWVVLLFIISLGIYLALWVRRALDARRVPASGRRALRRLLLIEVCFACTGLVTGIGMGLDSLGDAFAALVASGAGFGVSMNCIVLLRTTGLYKRWAARKGEVSVQQRIYLLVAGAFACMAVVTLAVHYFPAR